jgi:hypothetical protein
VWDLVLSLLRDPERLRAALEKLIEEERRALRGDPEREARVWLKKIAEVDHTRGRFQDMAAEGLITFDELRTKLEGLEEIRKTARRELDALEDRRRRLADLELDKATLLETYSEKASRGLDYFTPEDRHQAYKKLRLSVLVHPGGDLEVHGVLGKAPNFVQNNGTSRSTARNDRSPTRRSCALLTEGLSGKEPEEWAVRIAAGSEGWSFEGARAGSPCPSSLGHSCGRGFSAGTTIFLFSQPVAAGLGGTHNISLRQRRLWRI